MASWFTSQSNAFPCGVSSSARSDISDTDSRLNEIRAALLSASMLQGTVGAKETDGASEGAMLGGPVGTELGIKEGWALGSVLGMDEG